RLPPAVYGHALAVAGQFDPWRQYLDFGDLFLQDPGILYLVPNPAAPFKSLIGLRGGLSPDKEAVGGSAGKYLVEAIAHPVGGSQEKHQDDHGDDDPQHGQK